MTRRALVLLLLLGAAFPAAAEDGTQHPADFVITLTRGSDPGYEGPPGLAVLVDAQPGERYVWNLTLTSDYTVAEIRVVGAFDVERIKQVKPLHDTQHFVEITSFDPTEVDHPARVARIAGTVEDFVYRLGLPGTGNHTLVLERDVSPPLFTVGEIEHLTHFSFYVETRTDTPALADLQIRPVAGGQWVRNPTPEAALLQRFPIQGLDADREYEFIVHFTDWSGNEAASPRMTIRTAAEPAHPKPVVTPLTPVPNARPEGGVSVIRARIESPESPLPPGGVRLFVDLREVTEGFTVEDGVLTYLPPAPLGPGFHRVAVEVRNEAGGKGEARWSFTVSDPAPTPAAGFVAALALIAAAALATRRRRG